MALKPASVRSARFCLARQCSRSTPAFPLRRLRFRRRQDASGVVRRFRRRTRDRPADQVRPVSGNRPPALVRAISLLKSNGSAYSAI